MVLLGRGERGIFTIYLYQRFIYRTFKPLRGFPRWFTIIIVLKRLTIKVFEVGRWERQMKDMDQLNAFL